MAPSLDLVLDEKSELKHSLIRSTVFAVIDVVLLFPSCFGSFLISEPVAAVQWICCILTGFQLSEWLIFPSKNEYGKSKNLADTVTLKKKVRAALQSSGVLLMTVVVFHIVSILYGAPLLQSSSETFHFSLLMSVLIALPACLQLSPSLSLWSRLILGSGAESSIEKCILRNSFSTLMGAWFGAFPIPLDWDRPWQVWPISCCIGALIGNALGNAISATCLLNQLNKLKKRKYF